MLGKSIPTDYVMVMIKTKLVWSVRQWSRRPNSIPGRVIPKTQKMILDASLLNTQHYRVRTKGKVEQSSVVAIEKGAFGSPSIKVANFTYFYHVVIKFLAYEGSVVDDDDEVVVVAMVREMIMVDGFVWFYGISTIVGYLMPNTFSYI